MSYKPAKSKTTSTLFTTKTYLYNFDPLHPHFYIVKLGFTEVYIIFLISAQKHSLFVFVRTIHTDCNIFVLFEYPRIAKVHVLSLKS